VELEWWRFGDLVHALTALGYEVPGLALEIEALTAIADGGGERVSVHRMRDDFGAPACAP
jgi:hypothetical protein